ncbi:DUF2066 domain-containing protein [Flaviflagellibacter deserti]|uniref:DUF2066 domain-containing protein n=1 Tax=Flaviflagellibacter deserti TaxID=2267266 RepID=A0ABV9YYM0_9HYPH
MTGTIIRTAAFAAALLLSTLPGHADETVADLYRAWANVTGQREETRNPALLQGFRDVLVKVSGDARLVSDPRVDQLYSAQAASFYSYRDLMADIPKHDEQGTRDRPFEITIDYDKTRIDGALEALGRQPWSASRPRIIIFLAVKIADTIYVLSDKNDYGDLQRKSFGLAARRYGIPIGFPSDGLLRKSSLDFNSLLDPKLDALGATAKTAGGDIALAGSLIFSDELAGWIADWRLSTNGTPYHWGIKGVNFDEAFRTAIRGTAQILSGNGEPD